MNKKSFSSELYFAPICIRKVNKKRARKKINMEKQYVKQATNDTTQTLI